MLQPQKIAIAVSRSTLDGRGAHNVGFASQLFFSSIPLIVFALLFPLPPSRNSDLGSHSRLISPPALQFLPCISIAKKNQLFLASSTRVELCLPTLGALSSWSFFSFSFFANKFRISPRRGIRTHGPTLVAFEGYH